ncbi:hypothetical protein T492DRAFT_853733 [Pavlovales sp. CCMP2436]|nr:hypothetical protein T492DRAFT_853733 [Pavlovales sp. CCMP2436]
MHASPAADLSYGIHFGVLGHAASFAAGAATYASPPLTPAQIVSASHLSDDEKEHLLDALDKAESAGLPITLDDATAELREHEYCRKASHLLAAASTDGVVTADEIAAAQFLPDDEREHLAEAQEKRAAQGSALTLDEAHEALEEHREVRRLILALDRDGDGWLSEADLLFPGQHLPGSHFQLPADARQHLLETVRKTAQRAIALDEAHSALEEHREVVTIVRAIESGDGVLTAHNIRMADGVSEDEREHLLETLSGIKASGRELTVELAHQALEEHREVVAIVSQIDAGGDGTISAHNLAAAEVNTAVRQCLGRALEAWAARGAQLSTDEAHRVLEGCRHLWSDDEQLKG